MFYNNKLVGLVSAVSIPTGTTVMMTVEGETVTVDMEVLLAAPQKLRFVVYLSLLRDIYTGITGVKFSAIKTPPFAAILKIAEILPVKHATDLTQNVSDMRIEYYEALKDNNILRARVVVAFYYAGLSWTAVRWIAGRVKELIGLVPKVH